MKDNKYNILNEFEHNLMMIQELLGSGTTNNIQLSELGDYLFGNDFIGVYSSNQFPKDIKDGNMFIMNTSSGSGLHWVAFAKKDNKLYGYDSFGRDPNTLSKYWKDIKVINANKTGQDQAVTQQNCGSFCLSWLISFYKYGVEVIDII